MATIYAQDMEIIHAKLAHIKKIQQSTAKDKYAFMAHPFSTELKLSIGTVDIWFCFYRVKKEFYRAMLIRPLKKYGAHYNLMSMARDTPEKAIQDIYNVIF